jgi:hypothetical protein
VTGCGELAWFLGISFEEMFLMHESGHICATLISAQHQSLVLADGKLLTKHEEEREASKLRQAIVEEMQLHKDMLSLFITQDWDSYMRRMSRSGTWGGTTPQPAITEP